MLSLIVDDKWRSKVREFIGQSLLRTVRVVLINQGQAVGEAVVQDKGLTDEGFYIKAEYVNNSSNEVVYDRIAIYDAYNSLVGTISPNLTSIPPYKKITIEGTIDIL